MHRIPAVPRWAPLALCAVLGACSPDVPMDGPDSGAKVAELTDPDAAVPADIQQTADAADGAADAGGVDAAPDAEDAAQADGGEDTDGFADASGPDKLGAPTELFDKTGVHAIHVTLDPTNWQAYLDGVNKPEGDKVYNWYVASVTIDDVAYANLGVRGFGNGSQLSNPKKPNIRLKFDQFSVDAEGPEGQHSFRLKASGQDSTFLREPMVSELVRSIGGYAPRWSWAHVTVNGVDYGFYQLLETTDKRMFKTLFGNSDGHKYEAAIGCIGFNCPWGDCKKIPSAYKLDPGDGSELVALATAVTSATDEQFEQTIAEIIDLDALLADYAVDAVISNIDGLASAGQNYTLYGNTATGKLEVIMTGTDLTFGYFSDAWYDLLAPWGSPNSWCPGRTDWMFKRITQIPALKAKLLAKMRALQCGPFHAGTLVPLIDMYAKLLHKFVYEDPLGIKSDAAIDKGYTKLEGYVQKRADSLQELLGPCP